MKMRRLSVAIAAVAATFLFSSAAMAIDPQVQFGQGKGKNFVYASNLGVWLNYQKCAAFFKRTCDGYKACGETVYYPGIHKRIQDHLKRGYGNTVKVRTNRTNCLISRK